MCGIVGRVWRDPNRLADPQILDHALAAIWHRGPDGEGRLVEPGIAAGMRRLAIIDIGGGQQPVRNETGDVAVLFNGEIYNFQLLRAECEQRGHRFTTASDTEVLVHLYEEFGSDCLERLDGMFAFVIWDGVRRRALLARDRFGVKPLYLVRATDGLGFASEVKALARLGLTRPFLSQELLGDYLRHLWLPEPHTAWAGVERLPPGHFVIVEDGQSTPPRAFHRFAINRTRRITLSDAAAECGRLVDNAVKRQLVADVPVGAFLSGGLDSSLLVDSATRSGANIPAHTIRMRNRDLLGDPVDDDVSHSIAVASTLGLNHHLYDVEPQLADLLPKLLTYCDDPIADPAIISAFLICNAARIESRVLLSGLGADEIAAGYRRHFAASVLRPYYQLPFIGRRCVATIGKQLSNTSYFRGIARFPNARRLQKALGSIAPNVEDLPVRLASWTSDEWISDLGLIATDPGHLSDRVRNRIAFNTEDPVDATMAFDIAMYLPSHNLHYMDKMSMAASVEVRVPYLDNELVDFLLSLPINLLLHGRSTKRVLREAAKDRLPPSVLQRPKTGFALPIRAWLQGELNQMLNDLLSPSTVRRRGLLNVAGVSRMLSAFNRDVGDLAYPLWALMTLELWCQAVLDGKQ